MISNKLAKFKTEYDDFKKIENLLDELENYLKLEKIQFTNCPQIKLINSMTNPFKRYRSSDETMSYDSYIHFNYDFNNSIFTHNTKPTIYRRKMIYEHAYEFNVKKMQNQIATINFINSETNKCDLNKFYTLMKLMLLNNNNITHIVLEYLPHKLDHYLKDIDMIHQLIEFYKKMEKMPDRDYLKKIIHTYHQYLLAIID